MHIIVKFLSSWLILCSSKLVLCEDHWSHREQLINKEKSIALGASLKLQGLERCVNEGLMALKYNELDQAMENPNNFYPSVNFLKAVRYIDTSDIYNFIREMPKGAALHLHDTAMASPNYLYKLTFTDNLFVCWTRNRRLLLNFFLFHVDNRCEWIPLVTARETEGFEDALQSQLSMATFLFRRGANSHLAWEELLGTFATIEGLISYKPIFTAYLSEVLQTLYEDNVMYVELRTMLLPIYDLEGNDYSPADVATLLKEFLEDFQCSHPDFLGGKMIYTPSRMVEHAWMDRYMEIMDELSSEHPDFVAGFDLMGHEDLSYPLSKFVGSFEGIRNRVSFFFSAGETNWMGSSGDLNMYDAILLRPARIGHAFSLFSHPELLKIVKQQNIAIELCPISNQMMMLVNDLRNHPGKYLISHGYPVVVSSDNPGFWGAKTLSHDWYMVFMAMADRTADLKLLKQLAINSLQYSTINDKKRALQLWSRKWKHFINKMEHMCIEESVDQNETILAGPGIGIEEDLTTKKHVQITMDNTRYTRTSTEEPFTNEDPDIATEETGIDETEIDEAELTTLNSVDNATVSEEVSSKEPIDVETTIGVDSDTDMTWPTMDEISESVKPEVVTEIPPENPDAEGSNAATGGTAETDANSGGIFETGATEGAEITAGDEGITAESGATGEEGITAESGATEVEGITAGTGETGGEGITAESGATGEEGITAGSGATEAEGITAEGGATGAEEITAEGSATGAGEITAGSGADGDAGGAATAGVAAGEASKKDSKAEGTTVTGAADAAGEGVTKAAGNAGVDTAGTTIAGGEITKGADVARAGLIPANTNNGTTAAMTNTEGADSRGATTAATLAAAKAADAAATTSAGEASKRNMDTAGTTPSGEAPKRNLDTAGTTLDGGAAKQRAIFLPFTVRKGGISFN